MLVDGESIDVLFCFSGEEEEWADRDATFWTVYYQKQPSQLSNHNCWYNKCIRYYLFLHTTGVKTIPMQHPSSSWFQPLLGMKIETIWNHHPVLHCIWNFMTFSSFWAFCCALAMAHTRTGVGLASSYDLIGFGRQNVGNILSCGVYKWQRTKEFTKVENVPSFL